MGQFRGLAPTEQAAERSANLCKGSAYFLVENREQHEEAAEADERSAADENDQEHASMSLVLALNSWWRPASTCRFCV